ncbi:MAG: histidine phosphatase family protein [Deltaproteobacteria bacterium]|nr:histidine phosphatase family protein [Deltaproteobacteria bacterium]
MKSDFTTLYLLRHGETVNTLDGPLRYNGHFDVDITGKARAQMSQRGVEFAGLDISRIYASDLRRCRIGGEIIAGEIGCPLILNENLREMKMGDWEGLTLAEVTERFPEQVERKFAEFLTYRIPGSETVQEVEERIFPEFDKIIARHRGETIVIVAHGGVNLLFISRMLGLPSSDIFNLSQDFGCINKLLIGDDFSKVVMLNSSGLH